MNIVNKLPDLHENCTKENGSQLVAKMKSQ